MVETYALFRKYRRSLLAELADSSPRLYEALQQADTRLKAARDAAREASAARYEQALREAEDEASNVTRIHPDLDIWWGELERRADDGA